MSNKPKLETMLSTHHRPIALRRSGGAPSSRCSKEQHPRRAAHESTVVHDHGILALFTGGEMQMWMGAAYNLVRGDLLIVPEGMPHYRMGESNSACWMLATCTSCLEGRRWGEELARVFESVRQGASAVRTIPEEQMPRLEFCLEEFHADLGSTIPDPHSSLVVEGWMSILTASITAASPSAHVLPETAGATLVARALSYIEAHALEGISLQEVADAVSRAPAHVAAVMKEQTGKTVVDWITHARMAQARQLLTNTDETIEAVAARVGFQSASHFHRTFRRHHQMPPGKWRTSHRRAT